MLLNHDIFSRTLDFIHDEANINEVFQSTQACYSLCLLANLVHLAYLQRDNMKDPVQHCKFCVSLILL